MDVKAITRRLDVLQREADRNRPCKMTVTYEDGRQAIVDPCAVIDLCRGQGCDITRITADRPEYMAAAAIMTVLCHPAPNRRIEDFE